ncbi:hypothetical protein HDV00_000877, partial [Rhizophlyctis rosea]
LMTAIKPNEERSSVKSASTTYHGLPAVTFSSKARSLTTVKDPILPSYLQKRERKAGAELSTAPYAAKHPETFLREVWHVYVR